MSLTYFEGYSGSSRADDELESSLPVDDFSRAQDTGGRTFSRNPRDRGNSFNPCGRPQAGNDGIRYQTPSYTGFTLGTSYISDTDGRARGALATDNGLNVINPAFFFDYKLEGWGYNLGADSCFDTGHALPTKLTLDYSYASLYGSGTVSNLTFLNGLGITSPGGIPGVFVNTPTDVLQGYFDVDRDQSRYEIGFNHPFLYHVGPGPGGDFPSLYTISLVGSLGYGMIEQYESTYIDAFSPAFGPNAPWRADSMTEFDSDTLGASLGLETRHVIPHPSGITETFRIRGMLGYDFHDVTVTDYVAGSGLGGALNFTNTRVNKYNLGQLTASFTADYEISKGNLSWRIGGTLDYGSYPQFEYLRTDNVGGVPVPPALGLSGKTVYTVLTHVSIAF